MPAPTPIDLKGTADVLCSPAGARLVYRGHVFHNPRPRTYVVSGGRPHEADAPVNHPVDFTSTYRYAAGAEQGRAYAREGIPSFGPLEELLGRLEAGTRSAYQGEGLVGRAHEQPTHAEPAVLFSSGMAAISAALQLLRPGSHLVLPRHSYMGFSTLVKQMADRGLLTLHRVDIADTDQVIGTISDVATLAQAQDAQVMLWVESPTNPMLEVADLPALIAGAKRRGALTAVDNTFATPLRQQPLKHGADLVVHSVTKFLAGHSDLIMGAVITGREDLHAQLHEHRTLHGALPGPMEVFLALRGIRTLAVRLDAAERNAGRLASQLDTLAARTSSGAPQERLPLTAVTYPGLASHPQHRRAVEQLGGCGAIITLDTGSRKAGDTVLEALRLWTPATSLGGVESLAERRRRHPGEPETVPEGLIRLSVGIEDSEDLYADLLNALRTAAHQAG